MISLSYLVLDFECTHYGVPMTWIFLLSAFVTNNLTDLKVTKTT